MLMIVAERPIVGQRGNKMSQLNPSKIQNVDQWYDSQLLIEVKS